MVDLVAKVRQLLTAAGLHCVEAFPQSRLPRLADPLIAVGQSDIRLQPCFFSNYVGLRTTQTIRAVQVDFVVTLDIFSPYRGGGSLCAQQVRSVLAAVAVSINECEIADIVAQPVTYDENTDCFRSSIRLSFKSLMYQESTT